MNRYCPSPFLLLLITGLIMLATMVSAGCSTLGIPTADTFNARLAVAYSSVTAVRLSAKTLLDSERITKEDGQNVLDQTNHARAGLDIARKLAAADLKSADAKLAAIRTTLEALKGYLDTRDRSSP